MAMTAILRGRGVSQEQLGWIYLLGIVPGFKFLWAPVLDRYGFGRRGHFGIWLALMQALLIITLLWLGTLPMSPEQPLPLAALVTGCLLLTSVQDIAAYMAFYTPGRCAAAHPDDGTRQRQHPGHRFLHAEWHLLRQWHPDQQHRPGLQLAAVAGYGTTLGIALLVSIVLAVAILRLWRNANVRAVRAGQQLEYRKESPT